MYRPRMLFRALAINIGNLRRFQAASEYPAPAYSLPGMRLCLSYFAIIHIYSDKRNKKMNCRTFSG